jgi:hypothetical protein
MPSSLEDPAAPGPGAGFTGQSLGRTDTLGSQKAIQATQDDRRRLGFDCCADQRERQSLAINCSHRPGISGPGFKSLTAHSRMPEDQRT